MENSRTIKFRAWNKKKKEFTLPIVSSKGNILYIEGEGLEIMQYKRLEDSATKKNK